MEIGSGQQGSSLGSGIALGAIGAASGLARSNFARSGRAQIVVSGLAAGVGFGLGASAAPVARSLGDADARRGGLLLTGAGVAVALAGRHVPDELLLRDLGSVTTSLGVLGAAAGTAVATSATIEGANLPVVSGPITSGAVAGAAAGAGTIGLLALAGALHRAPVITEAARSIVVPADHLLAGVTARSAHARNAERTELARTALEALPGATPQTWDTLGKGRTFLRNVASPADIEQVMGAPALRAPVRLHVGIHEAATPEARAALMLERFDAVDGASFGTVHVIGATAIGDTNEMVPLAVEHATRGDSLTLMMQTSQSEPYVAMQRLGDVRRTLDLVLRGVAERTAKRDHTMRPRVLLSALCYGSLAPLRMAQDGAALTGIGVDHALFMGPPAVARHARAVAGRLDRGEIANGRLVRSRAELEELEAAGATTPRMLMAIQTDDPFRVGLHSTLVRPGRGTPAPFVPVTSAIATFVDSAAGSWKPGLFPEANHEFTAVGVPAANHAFGLGLTPAQVEAIDQHGVLVDHLRTFAPGA